MCESRGLVHQLSKEIIFAFWNLTKLLFPDGELAALSSVHESSTTASPLPPSVLMEAESLKCVAGEGLVQNALEWRIQGRNERGVRRGKKEGNYLRAARLRRTSPQQTQLQVSLFPTVIAIWINNQ